MPELGRLEDWGGGLFSFYKEAKLKFIKVLNGMVVLVVIPGHRSWR